MYTMATFVAVTISMMMCVKMLILIQVMIEKCYILFEMFGTCSFSYFDHFTSKMSSNLSVQCLLYIYDCYTRLFVVCYISSYVYTQV